MNKNRLKEYLLFNRNILIGFSGAFLSGAATSQTITRFTLPVVNSLISLVVETSVFLAIFGILFYFDNKDEFVGEQGKPTLWEHMVHPSLEALSKMADDKKMGGVFAGQRMGVVKLMLLPTKNLV